MKNLLASAFATFLLLSPLGAVDFDAEAFGRSLNGWKKNRTATYTIDNHIYRTHRPTLSGTPDGGLFMSTRVEHSPRVGKTTTSYIELTFGSSGTLLTGQIRIAVKGFQITTGLIERAVPPAPLEGGSSAAAPLTNPTTQLVTEMFQSLDTELVKLSKSDLAGKRDLFSRIFTKDYGSVDLSAALRHNLNLVLRYTR